MIEPRDLAERKCLGYEHRIDYSYTRRSPLAFFYSRKRSDSEGATKPSESDDAQHQRTRSGSFSVFRRRGDEHTGTMEFDPQMLRDTIRRKEEGTTGGGGRCDLGNPIGTDIPLSNYPRSCSTSLSSMDNDEHHTKKTKEISLASEILNQEVTIKWDGCDEEVLENQDDDCASPSDDRNNTMNQFVPPTVDTVEDRDEESQQYFPTKIERIQTQLDRFETMEYKELYTPSNSVSNSYRRSSEEVHRDIEEAVSKRKKKKKKRRSRSEKEFVRQLYAEIESERESLISKWKEEFEAERQDDENDNEDSSFAKVIRSFGKSVLNDLLSKLMDFLARLEVFISNLPLTIGAVGLAWVTMGVVWFKFMEETLDSCKPVHFNSPQCLFPEFPGCFQCETDNWIYKTVLFFHFFCDCVAGTMIVMFCLKCFLAWRVVLDELRNPTTSTPLGVVCMAIIILAAGRGEIGKMIVVFTSWCHFALAFWFYYMVLIKYRSSPDPSWFPNTTGLGYAAIKTWLYFPWTGKFLMSFAVTFLFGTFFLSLIQVSKNKKIPAQVCWIQMSAPSITLYALTIMGQPSPKREVVLESSSEIMRYFQNVHQHLYLPVQHFMFCLAVMGMASAVCALWLRWDVVRSKRFGPAHVAFCFPTLSHANAIQAYRGAIDSFSTIPEHSVLKIVLFSYWMTVLVVGTVVTIAMSLKFFYHLKEWTEVDVSDEQEPPALDQTEVVARDLVVAMDQYTARNHHRVNRSQFVNPAVLQANEAGTLVRVQRGAENGRNAFVRTRKVTALGFEPTMAWSEFSEERAALLDWVARNAPHTRQRTMSVPSTLMSELLQGPNHPVDVYGAVGHQRSHTDDLASWGGAL